MEDRLDLWKLVLVIKKKEEKEIRLQKGDNRTKEVKQEKVVINLKIKQINRLKLSRGMPVEN